MAKKDDNTAIWILLGVGAVVLFEKMRSAPKTPVTSSPVIQKTNPVYSAPANNTQSTVKSIISSGSKIISDLFGSKSSDTQIDDFTLQPMPADNTQYQDTDTVYTPWDGTEYAYEREAINNEAVMPDFEFQNISGISLVKKRIVRDEKD